MVKTTVFPPQLFPVSKLYSAQVKLSLVIQLVYSCCSHLNIGSEFELEARRGCYYILARLWLLEIMHIIGHLNWRISQPSQTTVSREALEMSFRESLTCPSVLIPSIDDFLLNQGIKSES